MNNEATRSRKDAAKARMAQLKAQLENLMKFAGIGKGNPRLVAQLARELKALVAQYGGGGDVSAPQGQVATPAASNSAGTVSTLSNAGNDGTADTTTAPASDTAGSNPDALAPAPADAVSRQGATDKTGSQGTDNEREEITQSANTATRQQPGLGKEDSDFFKLAREVAQKIKMLMALETRKQQTEAAQKEERAARNAIGDMDETISKTESAMAASNNPLAETASYSSSGDVSITLQASFSASA